MKTSSKHARPIPHREAIVTDLAKALALPGEGRQPRIIRNPLPTLGKVDLIVIWDRWKGLPFQDRSDIILEAFARDNQGRADLVYTAVGRTTEEAIALGYLPYRIVPAVRRGEEAQWERIDTAFREEGAVEIQDGLQLRFESLDEAQDAYLRLQERVPGPYWTIVEEVVRDS